MFKEKLSFTVGEKFAKFPIAKFFPRNSLIFYYGEITVSTAFMMRFNNEQGAIIADESTWHLSFKYGYRRCNYGDHVLNLTDPSMIERTGTVAAYAGVGFPSYHFEVVEKMRALLGSSQMNKTLSSLKQLSNEVAINSQQVHERMLNDRMRFLYGFNRDELNALAFEKEGISYDINQKSVIAEAKKILAYGDKSDAMVRIFENQGAIMGYTPEEGIQAYSFSPQHKSINLDYYVNVLGEGSQIASHIFGQVALTKALSERRQGFSMEEGLSVLLQVVSQTKRFQGKMGGYLQLIIIDGKASSPEKKMREFSDHRLRLASEVASAVYWNLLSSSAGQSLIEDLLLHDLDFFAGEDRLWQECTDSKKLEMYLMGYKAKPHSPGTTVSPKETPARPEISEKEGVN